MLFGQYEHSLDDKGRLMIPSKIRSQLSNSLSLYMLKGFEGCLAVYDQNSFDSLVKQLSSHSFFSKESREFVRLTLSSVFQLDIDKVGRIQIPTQVLKRYGINKDVIVLGVNDHMEIWDKQSFLKYEEEKMNDYESLAEGMVSKHE